MKSLIRISLAVGLAVVVAGCSSVDMPKGSSRGYHSVRLVRPGAARPAPDFAENSAEVNRMIQRSMANEFQAKGMAVDPSKADLVVGYLLLVQDNGTTAAIDDYFGYGRSANEILNEAHRRGVLENKRPDAFEAGAIVVDIMDARTNKLVFRNFAKRDIVPNLSASARQQRINEVVREVLAPFFR